MTADTGTTPESTTAPACHVGELTPHKQDGGSTGAAQVESPASRRLMALTALTAHPGNVRQDLGIDREFQASVAAVGVLIPLRVTPAGDAAWRVIDGHRRLAAAVAAGLAEVPVDVVADREGDEAAQYLDMAVTGRHQVPLTALEQADALFAAEEAGASRTRIRRATGISKAGVTAALAASRLEASTRNVVASLPEQLDFADLAILAEFRDDHVALTRLITQARYGRLQHEAELLRHKRAEEAEAARLRGQLAAAGYAVTDDGLPPGAKVLPALLHDGEPLTAEAHAACPGRGVYFRRWDPATPVHYCADPSAGGHAEPRAEPVSGSQPGGAAQPDGQPRPAEHDASRRVVIEGNRAWRAAVEVRRRWVTGSLLARRTAPREVAPFIAAQLLGMPEPLRSGLPRAVGSELLAQLAGQNAGQLAQSADTAAPGRLLLLMLAPIAAAYEAALADVMTWRAGPHYPCPRDSAGGYLAFLGSTGYQLSAIEQAVADGVPWAGETDSDHLPGAASGPDQAAAVSVAERGAAGGANPDSHAGAEDGTQQAA